MQTNEKTAHRRPRKIWKNSTINLGEGNDWQIIRKIGEHSRPLKIKKIKIQGIHLALYN